MHNELKHNLCVYKSYILITYLLLIVFLTKKQYRGYAIISVYYER